MAFAFLFACVGGYDLVRGLVRARREKRAADAAEAERVRQALIEAFVRGHRKSDGGRP
jgi:uncharacterized membrane protein SpoIIM required for sporulation